MIICVFWFICSHFKTQIIPKTSLDQARLGILFSGGIDSLVLAVLADKHLPSEEPIDLLNVAFGSTSFDVPDRQTGLQGLKELRRLSKRTWNFVQIDVTSEEAKKYQNRILELTEPRNSVMDITISTALWFAARGIGTLYDPKSEETILPSSNSLIPTKETLQQVLHKVIQDLVKEKVFVFPNNYFPTDEHFQVTPIVDKKRKKKQGDYSSSLPKLIFLDLKKLATDQNQFNPRALPAVLQTPQIIGDTIQNLFPTEVAICTSNEGLLIFRISTKTSKPNTPNPPVSTNLYQSRAKVLLVGHGADEQVNDIY